MNTLGLYYTKIEYELGVDEYDMITLNYYQKFYLSVIVQP